MSGMSRLDDAMNKMYNFEQLDVKEFSFVTGYMQARFDVYKHPLPSVVEFQNRELLLKHTGCEERVSEAVRRNAKKERAQVHCEVYRSRERLDDQGGIDITTGRDVPPFGPPEDGFEF